MEHLREENRVLADLRAGEQAAAAELRLQVQELQAELACRMPPHLVSHSNSNVLHGVDETLGCIQRACHAMEACIWSKHEDSALAIASPSSEVRE